MKFGEFVKELRMKLDLSLREFCKINTHDPSNWSKTERGLTPPPADEETLKLWALQLGLKEGTGDWHKFFDLAFTDRGRIPSDILRNEQLVEKLPLFFRTMRGQKPTEDEMKNLVELLRREL